MASWLRVSANRERELSSRKANYRLVIRPRPHRGSVDGHGDAMACLGHSDYAAGKAF